MNKQNSFNIGYFNLYLNKLYGNDEIIIIGKNVYYRNVILFIERIRNLLIIKGIIFIRININIIFRGFTFI